MSFFPHISFAKFIKHSHTSLFLILFLQYLVNRKIHKVLLHTFSSIFLSLLLYYIQILSVAAPCSETPQCIFFPYCLFRITMHSLYVLFEHLLQLCPFQWNWCYVELILILHKMRYLNGRNLSPLLTVSVCTISSHVLFFLGN